MIMQICWSYFSDTVIEIFALIWANEFQTYAELTNIAWAVINWFICRTLSVQ